METLSNLPTNVPVQKLMFQYDAQSRCIHKKVNAWDARSSVFSLQSSVSFLYDGQPSPGGYGSAGWNLLAEVDKTNAVVRSYAWGLDLSGTEQGAGGIGGLLWVNLPQASNTQARGSHFVAFDGNGNVAALLNAQTAQTSAEYEYGPFGETIRATGPAAAENVFRFSAKYTDGETGLLYYGRRYLQPPTGRWPNRDPINELGHHVLTEQQHFRLNLEEEKNLYSLVRNNPANLYDADGRALGPILVVGGVSVPAALCIRSQYEAAHNRYVGDREGHPVSDPAGDSFVHCWTSCRISKVCGGGLAQLAGLGKEGLDSFRRAWREILEEKMKLGTVHGSIASMI